MALWRKDGFAEDEWTRIGDADPAPAEGAIIVSAERWAKDGDELSRRADPVGIAISAGKDAGALLAEAAKRPLVALSFAKFADGRAFSYAQLLRERHGFVGELRAIGDVLLDGLPLMLRCGFDSFEIANEPTLRALRRGHLPDTKLFYQPSVEPHEKPAGPGKRPWLRKKGA
jgi:uncharacterized protein (DUF934 family)